MKPLRILIVEDHPDIREALGMFLEMLDYVVAYAADADSALVLAEHGNFNVLLTDIQLPGRDGWALLRELRDRRWLPPLSISMSGHVAGNEKARSREAGCHAHLLKPFRIEELERALQRGG